MTTHATKPKAKAAKATTITAPPAANKQPVSSRAVSQRAAVPLWAQLSPTSAAATAPLMVMREEKIPSPPTEPEKQAEKKDVGISFGSAAVPWFLVRPLILKFPSRWQAFAQKGKDDLTKDDRELAMTSNATWAG